MFCYGNRTQTVRDRAPAENVNATTYWKTGHGSDNALVAKRHVCGYEWLRKVGSTRYNNLYLLCRDLQWIGLFLSGID